MMQQTAIVDRACFAGASKRQLKTQTCNQFARFAGDAVSNNLAITPHDDEGCAPPCMSAMAADVVEANKADGAASSTTSSQQLAKSSVADDIATQDRTPEGTTTGNS